MSPIPLAHHIVRRGPRNGFRPTCTAALIRLAFQSGSLSAPQAARPAAGGEGVSDATAQGTRRRLERDVLGTLERQDLSGVIGGGDLQTEPFDDLAGLVNLGGV
jgi:hypothetical protein